MNAKPLTGDFGCLGLLNPKRDRWSGREECEGGDDRQRRWRRPRDAEREAVRERIESPRKMGCESDCVRFRGPGLTEVG